MIKKTKIIALCCLILCSINTSYFFAINNKDGASKNPDTREKLLEEAVKYFSEKIKKGWSKKILWILVPVLVQVTVTKILAPILDRIFYQKENDLRMLKELLLINKELKIQLDYIKKHCHDVRLIKKIENDYLETCIKIMELQKKYQVKYIPRKQPQQRQQGKQRPSF